MTTTPDLIPTDGIPTDGIPTDGIPTDQPPVDTDRSRRQRAGGIAALVKAATYVVGFVVLGAYLVPEGFGDGDAADAVEFLVDHQAALYSWYAVLYLVGGAALVSLVLAVHDRLGRADRSVVPTATAFGLIWSGLLLASGLIALVGQRAVVDLHATDPDQAASAWAAIGAVQDALGGGIELVGGLWVLLVAWAGLRTARLPRGLCRLGLAIGVAGIVTVVPALVPVAAALFGLGFIAWFVWVGLVLLRPAPSAR